MIKYDRSPSLNPITIDDDDASSPVRSQPAPGRLERRAGGRGVTRSRRGDDVDDATRYRQVARTARHPPGGIPEGWQLLDVVVSGEYDPDTGPWWQAIAHYGRQHQATGARRLIGAGPSIRAALTALERRLSDPLATRRHQTLGGWDTHRQPGRVVDEP